MANARRIVHDLGGIAHRQQLIARGVTGPAISAAVRRGELQRVRRAWYALPTAAADACVAIRIGGRLGGASALASYGVWTPRSTVIFVSLPPNAARLRENPIPDRPVVRDWRGSSWQIDATRPAWREPLSVALVQAARSLSTPEIVAVLDSALHQRLISMMDATAVLDTAGVDVEPGELDRAAESGGESLVRFQLSRVGIPCRSQVALAGIGRVDFVIGDRLVIEVDGAEFHAGVDAFARDRRRDLDLVALGFIVVWLSYVQVVADWEASRDAIRAIVDRGDHLSRQAFSGRQARHAVTRRC